MQVSSHRENPVFFPEQVPRLLYSVELPCPPTSTLSRG